MIVHVSEVVRGWLGWCPNTPTLRNAHPVFVASPAAVLEQPGGGSGSTGRISRGIWFAIEGMKILNRNRSLFWSAILTGLVAGVVFIAQYGMGLLAVYPYDALDFPRWLVLTFGIALFAAFGWNVLLAGILLSLSPEKRGAVSFREGLFRTRQHLRRLTDWSVILALWCTAVFAVLSHLGFSRYSLSPFAHLFPFRFILLPEVYHVGPMGGTYAMLYAVSSTMAMATIIGLFTVMTLFVMPLLVLENRSLPDALAGSFALMKTALTETLTVFLGISAALFVASLPSLLFGTVYEIVAPNMQLFWYPGHGWIAAALLFMLGLSALVFIGSTITGIATLSIYQYAKTSRVPEPMVGPQRVASA